MNERNTAAAFGIALLAASTVASAAVSVGDTPELKLKTLSGKKLTSEDLKGQLVMLEFWATWCGPCVDQIPHLKKLHKKLAPKGMRLISVSRDSSRRPVVPFIKRHGMNWTHVIDKEQPQELGPRFGVSGIPHAFIISPEGKVLWRGHPAGIDRPLKQALQEHTPTPPIKYARKKALQKIEQAASAIDKNNDFGKAYELVKDLEKRVLEDGKVKAAFRRFARRFHPQGPRGEAASRFLGENPKAKKRLKEMGVHVGSSSGSASAASSSSNSSASADANSRKAKVAQRKLQQADRLRESGEDLDAYEKYQWITERAGQTPAGRKAAERVKQYEADEQFMAKVEQARRERKAKSAFNLGELYRKNENTDAAKKQYQKVIDQYPDTDWADKARTALAKL